MSSISSQSPAPSVALRSRRVGVWLAALVALGLSVACGAETAREERKVSGFDQIRLSTVGELHIRQTGTESLVIEAEKRLLPKILADVKGGVLHLRFAEGSFSTRYPIRFHVTVRTLSHLSGEASGNILVDSLESPSFRLDHSGSGDVRVGRLKTPHFSVRASGSSDIAIGAGEVDRATVELAGSGRYDALGLATSETAIFIRGSGDATLSARDRLDARVSGSGDIRYRGSPKVAQRIEGSGTVEPLGR
jgi:hypothetical protein